MKQSKENIEFGRVAVLLGGNSAERNISLLSGEAIYQALIENDIDAIKIDSQSDLYQQLLSKKVDRVFIALHGRDGEDGVIQGFLRTLKIPFTGSDVGSSALAMNKLISKRIWRQMNLATAAFLSVQREQSFGELDAKKTLVSLGNTLFVKPIREGSSVGMSKVRNSDELIAAVAEAQRFDDVLIEQFVDGREYTVSILNGEALPSISMVTPNEFYDYDAKYCSKTTEYFCPSGLGVDQERRVGELALKAFNAIGCSGWGRVDFIQDKTSGEFMLLEANTVPGMTTTSLVPKAAKAYGLDFSQLVMNILATSLTSLEVTNG